MKDLVVSFQSGELIAFTSVITITEVLPKPVSQNQKQLIDKFIKFLKKGENLNMLEISSDIAESAGYLRGKYDSLKTMDAIQLSAAIDAGADAKISDFMDTNLKIENCIIGDERIQLWLKEYPGIVKVLELNKLFIPLEFYEKDLREIIVKFSEMKEQLKETVKRKQDQLKFVDKTRKNELNKLSKEYFDFMKRNSLAYFHKIGTFLKDPVNQRYKNYYDNTISDLQGKIVIKRSEFFAFEELLETLFDYIFENSPELKDRRRLIRVFLHYMYFNCDIGVEE
jgi:predicted nucleic acid-binding protein